MREQEPLHLHALDTAAAAEVGCLFIRLCLRSPQVVNDELKMGKGKVRPQLLQAAASCCSGCAGFRGQLTAPCIGALLFCATVWLMSALPCRQCLQIGAQCAHAAVGAVERLHELRQTAALAYWERCGQPKVCLRASSTQVLRGERGGVGRPAAAAATAHRLRRTMPPLPHTAASLLATSATGAAAAGSSGFRAGAAHLCCAGRR